MLSAALRIPLGWGKVKDMQSPTPNCTGAGVPLGRRGFSHSSLLGLWDYNWTLMLTPAAHWYPMPYCLAFPLGFPSAAVESEADVDVYTTTQPDKLLNKSFYEGR